MSNLLYSLEQGLKLKPNVPITLKGAIERLWKTFFFSTSKVYKKKYLGPVT